MNNAIEEDEHETHLRYHYASNTAVLDTTRPEEKEGLLHSLPDGVAKVKTQRVDDEVVGWTIEVPLYHFGYAFEATHSNSRSNTHSVAGPVQRSPGCP